MDLIICPKLVRRQQDSNGLLMLVGYFGNSDGSKDRDGDSVQNIQGKSNTF